MENGSMNHETILGYGWLGLASMAGAITALAFKQFQPLAPRERALLVFVGFVFAIFVGPLIVNWLVPGERQSSRIVGAMYYMIAAGANWVLPWVLERITGRRPGDYPGLFDQPSKETIPGKEDVK